MIVCRDEFRLDTPLFQTLSSYVVRAHTRFCHIRNYRSQKWRVKTERKKKPIGALVDSQSVRTAGKGVLNEDMMEAKKLKEGKDIFSLTSKGSYYRLRLALQGSVTIEILQEKKAGSIKKLWGDSAYQVSGARAISYL